MKKLFSSRFLIAVLATIAVVAIAGGMYFYMQYQTAQRLLHNSTTGQEQVDQVVSRVGRLIELPKDESPTLATVADVTKLKGQPFFENAKNGFKVLIYTKAKKAILYDPFTDKIVEVAPVNIGNAQVSPTPTGTVQQYIPQQGTAPVVTSYPKATVTP